jgi:hypothetical protein
VLCAVLLLNHCTDTPTLYSRQRTMYCKQLQLRHCSMVVAAYMRCTTAAAQPQCVSSSSSGSSSSSSSSSSNAIQLLSEALDILLLLQSPELQVAQRHLQTKHSTDSKHELATEP